ncbi:MAG: hypothetical protein J3Q66DRAFT_53838 [Benniella sp.]|nr:MAG: hypothetical protein J3Q66DRAFT_53838 [Benniella sp.]
MPTGPRMMLGSTSDTSSRHAIMRHGFQSPSEMKTVTRRSFAIVCCAFAPTLTLSKSLALTDSDALCHACQLKFLQCSSHQASRIPPHAKCSGNNDNGGSSGNNIDSEDDNESDSSSTEDDISESDRSSKRKKVCSKPELEESLTNIGSATIRPRESSACQMQHLVEFRKLLEVIEKQDRRLSAREKALTKREEVLVEKVL